MERMIQEAYTYLRAHPDGKLHVGKHIALSKPLRVFLSLLEQIGFSSYSETIYKKRYYRMLPEINDFYLKDNFHLNASDQEFVDLKNSGQIPKKKLIWKVLSAAKKLEEIHLYYEMKSSTFLLNLLSDKEKNELELPHEEIAYLGDLTSTYKKLKRVHDNTVEKSLFDRAARSLKGSQDWVDIDIEQLQTACAWFNEGLISVDISDEDLLHIFQRKQILRIYPWISLFITDETFAKISFTSRDLTPDCLKEISRIFEIVKWAKEQGISESALKKILLVGTEFAKVGKLSDKEYSLIFKLIIWHQEHLLDIDSIWTERHAYIHLYAEIERVFDINGLKTFLTLYHKHPFSTLESFNQESKNNYLFTALNAAGAQPETLLSHPDIASIVRVEIFTLLQRDLEKEVGKEIAAFLVQNFSKRTTSFSQDLAEDSNFLKIDHALQALRKLKQDLLIEEDNFQAFLLVAEKAFKGIKELPLPKVFFEDVHYGILGPEYKALITFAKTQKITLSDDLSSNLSLLLPYSRNQTKKLFDFYFHRVVFNFIKDSLNYIYTPEIKAFVHDFLKLIFLKKLPLDKQLLFNTEKIILFSIEKIWSSSLSPSHILSILNRLSITQESLMSEELFITFGKRVKEIETKVHFLEQGDLQFDKFYFRAVVKGLHAFCKIMILPHSDKNHDALDEKFFIIEEKFDTGSGFSTTLHLLSKYAPGHFMCLLTDYLHKGEMKTLLTESLDDVTGRLKGMLARLNEDLYQNDYETLRHTYNEDKFSHFPEAFLLPVITLYLKLIEQGRTDHIQVDSLFPSENPPIARFLLKNIPLLITVFEGIEMMKNVKELSSFLISSIVPAVLQLSSPYFNSQELKAVSQLIGLLTPYLLHKHDFKPIINYLRFLDKTIRKPGTETKLNEEEKRMLIQHTSLTIIWVIDEVLRYRSRVEPLIEQLKNEFHV